MATEFPSSTAGAADATGDPATKDELASCDLVMKGGITSGVIYPKLVSQLSRHYRFKNIGGTSAGAIAAGACAAAEYGRGQGRPGAFAALEALPTLLGQATAPSNRSKLFTLFQPTAALRRHFAVLVGALNAAPADAVSRVLAALLKMHPAIVFIGVLLGVLLLSPLARVQVPALGLAATVGTAAGAFVLVAAGLWLVSRVAARGVVPCVSAAVLTAAALAGLYKAVLGAGWSVGLVGVALATQAIATMVIGVVVLAVALRFGATLLRGLHGNGYGMCSGRTVGAAPGAAPGLTDWLTSYFNELAGLALGHRPLTFGDLWGTQDAGAPRQINLEVMTSALSQQMVYGIPFRDGTPRFFYDPDEWAELFPPEVLRWLKEATATHPDADASDPLPAGARVVSAGGKPLAVLPCRADLPVVVAVRMSLSFPVLLSAVPLYAIDWSRTENQHKKTQLDAAARAGTVQSVDVKATRVWFSDGGIGSNMPLHMFDALLPGHPTFAVNLKAEHPDMPIHAPEHAGNEGGRVYLPGSNVGGRLRHWPEPSDGQPLGGLLGFMWSIVNTMQNWRDEILFPYPGFRDRIVQISQRATEGGLNLDMPEKSITDLANAGGMAAARLVDRFHPHGLEQGRGWTNHQAVRLGTFLGTMQPGSVALQPSLASGAWSARLADIKGYRLAERGVAGEFLKGLEALGAQGLQAGVLLEGGALKPVAQIRIAPRI